MEILRNVPPRILHIGLGRGERLMMNSAHAIGRKAKDFALRGTDGRTYSLADIRGPKGTLVVFICNHCPDVKASINRIVAEAKALRECIGTIATQEQFSSMGCSIKWKD
jgi:peroxiredoxin